MSTKLTIGFSPCPNDTFIFDALLHKKIDTYGLEFEPVIEDVQLLNERAIKGELDITKMSFFAYANVFHHYKILNSGSALGKKCGPLLISKNEISDAELSDCKVAIPGVNTTANLLLSIFYPRIKNKTAVLFSEIEELLINEKFDAGVIIHENRFTYEKKGLKKIADLGDMWETETGQHIPLGCICMRRNAETELQKKVDAALTASVIYAFENTADVMPFVKQHSQEIEASVMLQHIALYVNEYSVDLGAEGKHAIEFLFQKAFEKGLIKQLPQDVFIS